MLSPQAQAFLAQTKQSQDLLDLQTATELQYSKKTMRQRIENEIMREQELQDLMVTASLRIFNWTQEDHGYASKNERLATFISNNDPEDVIFSAMCMVLELDERSDLITSLAGQLGRRIDGMDYIDAVTTSGELLTIMCDQDLFDMERGDFTYEDEETGEQFTTQSWYISNPWELSEATSKHIKRAMYLPPMLTKPMPLKHNKSSPHLTQGNESLILGKGNHHDGNICLESLERFNNIPLSLNVDMLKNVTDDMLVDSEHREAMLRDPKRKEQHEKLLKDSYRVYAYLIKNGNRFHIPHKPDKRGRTYSQGYHCSTQGNAFRKSIVELANKEVVNGTF